MKGYSFQELVNLAEAAVKRAGDTMTGILTAPRFTMNAAQGTGAGDAVRYDFTSAQMPNRRVDIGASKDLNTYQTPGFYSQRLDADAESGSNYPVKSAGALLVFEHAGVCQIYIAYPSNSNRRIYYRNLYNGTWSAWTTVYDTNYKPTPADIGAVAINGENVDQLITLRLARGIYTGNSALPLEIGHGAASSGNFYMDIHTTVPAVDYDYRWTYYHGGAGASFSSKITVPELEVGSQGSNAASVARRDYVDGQVATRAPTAHTHTVAAITDLRPQDANATANTLALRDGSADVNARLFRATYSDESAMSGAIAFRVNDSTNNYTRYCNNPESVRNWMKGAKTDWQMGWRAYIEHADNPMTEYLIPGKAAVITYLTGDGNYRIDSSNGAGGAVTDRMRIDPSGNLFATAAIHEAGQRVYSPNNQPHYSHNHTAAQGNADIVAGSYGQIGTYGFFYNLGTVASVGTLRSGSTLRWNAARDKSTANLNPSGTWKCVGHANQNGSSEGEACTLWIRVA